MTKWLAAIALTLVTATGAQAFEPPVDAVVGKYKQGKLVDFRDVGTLMRESARWCYDHVDHSCAWADTYLEVDDVDASFEITNAWDAERNIGYTDHAVFKDNRICQSGYDWIQTVWAESRDNAASVSGRPLHDLKQEIASMVTTPDRDDCFDYLYLGAEPQADVVTLLQRQYIGGEYDPAADVEVTIFMNEPEASSLAMRW
nr:hypothetical protein [uncultured Devosia sp.]